MKKSIILRTVMLLALILTCKTLPAQEFVLMPDYPRAEPFFRAFMYNDGYMGIGTAREYDDLRSYGFTFEGTPNDRLSLKLLYSGITQRGAPDGENRNDGRWSTGTPDPARFDRLELYVGWSFLRFPLKGGEAALAWESGFTFDGALGGLFLQEIIHKTGKVDRPIPEHYLDPDFVFLTGFRGTWTTGYRYPLVLSAGFRLDTRFQPRGDFRVQLWDASRDSRLFAGLEYYATADGNSDPQRRFLNAYEEGLNAKFGFAGTHLTLFQTVNLLSREGLFDRSLRTAGGFGFTTASGLDAPRREGNLSVETAVMTGRSVQTLLYFQPVWYRDFFPPVTYRSGFWFLTGNGNSAPRLDGNTGDWRLQHWAAGFRISLLPPLDRRLPDLFIDAGLGIKWKQVYTIDEYRAVPESESWHLTAEVRVGLELPLPLPVREGRNRYGFQLFYGFEPVLGPEGPRPDGLPCHGIGLALTIKDQGFLVGRERIFKEAPGP